MRTRRAPGQDSKTRGGSISIASPSTPISMGPAESTRKSGASHSSQPVKLRIRPAASRLEGHRLLRAGDTSGDHAEGAEVQPGARAPPAEWSSS